MIRRLTIVGLVSLLLLTNFLYADEVEGPPSTDDIEESLTVIMDCVSASLVTECTDTTIKLPCSNVSMDSMVHLPKRITYFLADPAEFKNAMSPSDSSTSFFASFLSVLNTAIENPMVSAVYLAMSTRGYHQGDYYLSGSITFEYPEGLTLEDILTIWSIKEETDKKIKMVVDMNLYSRKLANPVSISGSFDMSVDKNGSLLVKSADTYTINGYAYKGGEFRMT